jgi:maltose O-acetyltransferase
MNKTIFCLLYKFLGKNMPLSNSKFSLGSKKIRGYLANKILKKAGSNINIEKGAQFSDLVEIGNNSGIGVNCMLSGKVIIGDNVMMGPEVYIYIQIIILLKDWIYQCTNKDTVQTSLSLLATMYG